MNPLFQQLSKANPMMEQIRNIGQMMRGNPQAILQSNPQAQQLISQYGDPQKAFYALAKQMGVDPNEVMRTLNM